MSRILVIDDEVEMLRVCSAMLQAEGHEVTCAQDGDEGVRHLRHSAVDLVITDILMPGREGLETIVTLSRDHPGLRVIAMSGGGRSISAGDCLALSSQLGAVATLQKPFSQADLMAAVQKALVGTLPVS